MAIPLHIQWFIKSQEEYKTKDGKLVEVWEFKHNEDETESNDDSYGNYYGEDYLNKDNKKDDSNDDSDDEYKII